MDGVHKLDELRGRLAGLSRLLAGAEVCSSPPGPLAAAAAAAAPAVTAVSASPSRPRPAPGHAASPLRPASSSKPGGGSRAAPPFKTVVPPSKSVLRAANQPVAVGPAYAAFKEEEARWLAQKGELQLMLNREKKRSGKLEAELKRVQVGSGVVVLGGAAAGAAGHALICRTACGVPMDVACLPKGGSEVKLLHIQISAPSARPRSQLDPSTAPYAAAAAGDARLPGGGGEAPEGGAAAA